jgi:hypothetical protein
MAKYYHINGDTHGVVLREQTLFGGRIGLDIVDITAMPVGSIGATVDDGHEVAMGARSLLENHFVIHQFGTGLTKGERFTPDEERVFDLYMVLRDLKAGAKTVVQTAQAIHLMYKGAGSRG